MIVNICFLINEISFELRMETISMLMIFELAKITDIEISLIKTCIHCLRAYTLEMTNPQ